MSEMKLVQKKDIDWDKFYQEYKSKHIPNSFIKEHFDIEASRSLVDRKKVITIDILDFNG